LQGKA